MWPPNSPDLIAVDYIILEILQMNLYITCICMHLQEWKHQLRTEQAKLDHVSSHSPITSLVDFDQWCRICTPSLADFCTRYNV